MNFLSILTVFSTLTLVHLAPLTNKNGHELEGDLFEGDIAGVKFISSEVNQ